MTAVVLGRGEGEFQTRHGVVRIEVEIADRPETRAVGLMHRDRLPDGVGAMVFVFAGERAEGPHMENVRFPLSVAFLGEGGVILRILDMDVGPPYPTYDPGVAYRGAVEVERGAFARWGVAEGDRFRLLD